MDDIGARKRSEIIPIFFSILHFSQFFVLIIITIMIDALMYMIGKIVMKQYNSGKKNDARGKIIKINTPLMDPRIPRTRVRPFTVRRYRIWLFLGLRLGRIFTISSVLYRTHGLKNRKNHILYLLDTAASASK